MTGVAVDARRRRVRPVSAVAAGVAVGECLPAAARNGAVAAWALPRPTRTAAATALALPRPARAGAGVASLTLPRPAGASPVSAGRTISATMVRTRTATSVAPVNAPNA